MARAERTKILGWSLFAGLPMGAAAGYASGHIVLGTILGPFLIWTAAWIMAGIAGKSVRFSV